MAIGVSPQHGTPDAHIALDGGEPHVAAAGDAAGEPRACSTASTAGGSRFASTGGAIRRASSPPGCSSCAVRLSSATDDLCVETLAPFEVESHQVPGLIAQRLALPIHQLTSLGFRAPIWHVVDDDVHQLTTHMVTLVHASGRAWARVHSRTWSVRTPPVTKTFHEIVSETAPGPFLWSLSTKADLAAPTSCTVVRTVNATPGYGHDRDVRRWSWRDVERPTRHAGWCAGERDAGTRGVVR